ILFLTVDPTHIDVNVHPTKTEIKFEDEKLIYAVLRAAVKRALGKYNISPSIDFNTETSFGNLKPFDPLNDEIKIPTIPLHTWLPDAHVEAPTPVSIILAGVLLKIGGYGIIRICYGIFPEAAIYFSYWIGLIGVVSILYGAFIALASTDLKRMIAYSSISHMGFVILGIASLTSEGVNGAIFQMISHGVLSTMLFYLVGVIYLRVQDREIAAFRGLAQPMPRYTLFVVIAFFASLGLPGLSGFIGEAFTLIGAFKSASVNALLPRGFAILASVGILIGAAYFLWTLQRMFFGAPRFKGAQEWHLKLKDLTATEYLVLIPLALITILLGIFPSILFDASNNTINAWVHETWIHGIAIP
ncbi:MAG: NADH-quinone oxidoreductase subunit M, partial [Cytophagia bacterium]|nr:NADH-quinone oxidoreductase subunit M [Cytophagia bacterium]